MQALFAERCATNFTVNKYEGDDAKCKVCMYACTACGELFGAVGCAACRAACLSSLAAFAC